MNKFFGLCTLVLFVFAITPIESFAAGTMTLEAQQLKSFYLSLNVENLWKKGSHVNWETGDSLSLATKFSSTHCSAFVAAALKRKGIYILRPPQHSVAKLANFQYDYLLSIEGRQAGWIEIATGMNAIQDKANEGYFVVAVVKNSNPNKSGHVAFIYPNNYEKEKIDLADLAVVQAGHINGVGIPFLQGFENHKKQVENGDVKFFFNSQKFSD